ncbi:MAG TPA: cytochrome P450 [Acidimicrobiia bacterium]|nr:cytochrome P450 [Acidimicrobiia bacterium]
MTDTTLLATPALDDEVTWFMTSGHERRGPIRRDPFPFYDRLRAVDPVHRSVKGPWLLTSYEVCNAMLRDDRWTKGRILTDDSDGALAERVFLGSLVFRDPPDHTRLRRIVAPLFTVSAINKRRARTRAIAATLLNGLSRRDGFDFRREFASELPVRLICEFIGIPPDWREEFLMWAETVRELQELSGRSGDDLRHADDKAQACLDFFGVMAAEKRKRPGDDIVSMLLAAADADEQPLTHEEFTAMLIILHVGGHSTTTDVIATGLFHLLRNPDAERMLRRDPGLVPSAVEEMLRYDTAVTVATPRVAAEEMTLGGRLIPAGEKVYAVLGAANRDPAQFADPHRFDIGRTENRHLSFAAGAHFCLGAHLGRQEAQEAFNLLFTEYPALEPAGDLDSLEWQDSFPHRGLVSLPVAWRR